MADASEILRRISQKEREFRSRDFIAPYASGSKFALVSMGKGMLYRFRITGFSGAGIGSFHPTTPNDAVFTADAPFDQSRKYLDALPRIQLILSYQCENGWMAYPFNLDSARKFLVEGPVLVLNVSDAQRFDAVTARFDGANFWYDELFAGGDPMKADQLRECFSKGLQSGSLSVVRTAGNPIKGLTPEDKESYSLACVAWKQFAKLSVEQKIKGMLESGGGRMNSFVVRGKNIEIKWISSSGRHYNSLVNKDTLDVVSAGICLSGEDEKFHLKDLPHIIEQGERRNLIVPTRHYRIPDPGIDEED